MPIWWDRLSGLKRWGRDSAVENPSDTDANAGFAYLGTTKPSAQLHDALFQYDDDKDNWLFKQIKSLTDQASLTLSDTVITSLRDAVNAKVAAEATSRSSADSTLNTAITNEATTRANNDADIRLSYVRELRIGGNRTFLGWDGGALDAQVDAAYLGRVWTSSYCYFSPTGNGYTRLGNGLIMQWCSAVIPSGFGYGVTLPIAFPNSFLSVTASYNASIPPSGGNIGAEAANNSQIRAYNTSSIDNGCSFFALGY